MVAIICYSLIALAWVVMLWLLWVLPEDTYWKDDDDE